MTLLRLPPNRGVLLTRDLPRARVAVLLAVVASLLLPAAAAVAQRVDLSSYAAIDAKDLDERYRTWFEEEIGYLIGEDEREVFLRLDSDELRDRFIEQFWVQRDPTPGTPRNEYRALHYERLDYANGFLGRGTSTPGWRTDRGRMHIVLGEPMSKTRLANDMLTYPTEVWFYQAPPGLGMPPAFYVVFYQRHGVGDYKLYSPLSDGPAELLNPAGEQAVRELLSSGRPLYGFAPTGFGDISGVYEILRETGTDLAQAAFNLLPAEAGMEFGSPLESEMLLAKIDNISQVIGPNPEWALRVLTGHTEAAVSFETLPLTVVATAMLDPSGEPFIHYAALTEGSNLNLNTYEDRIYFTFEVAGAVTDREGRVLQSFQNHLEGDLTAENVRRFRSSPFAFMDLLPAVPGLQTLEFILKNNVTNEFGRGVVELDVPSPHPERVTSTTPLLFSEMGALPGYDPYSSLLPFQVGELVFVPNLDGKYSSDGRAIVVQQILLPEGHSGAIEVSYTLRNDRGEPMREESTPADPPDIEELGLILQLTTIDLEGLSPGVYELSVDVDVDDKPAAAFELTITSPDQATPRTFINSQPAPPATDPQHALERAYQYRALGQPDAAIAALEYALSRDSQREETLRLQTELLMEAGRYQELDDLLTAKLMSTPNDVELLELLAETNTRLGDHYDAIRYYERVRMTGGHETPDLLNSLASEYLVSGEQEKAKGLLERSLELDADQPEIRTLLRQIRPAEASQGTKPLRLPGDAAARQDLPIKTRAHFFPGLPGETLLLVAFEVGKGPLTFAPVEGSPTPSAILELRRVVTRSVAGGDEEVYQMTSAFAVAPDDGSEEYSSTHCFGVPLQPGVYTLALEIVDLASGQVTSWSESIDVPDFGSGTLKLTSVLAATATDRPAVALQPDQIVPGILVAGLLVQDDLDRRFSVDDTVELIYVVTGAKTDSTTGRPRLEASYRILLGDEDQSIARFPLQALQSIAVGQPIPLSQIGDVTPGESYRIEITVKDLVSGQEDRQLLSFTILAETGR